jgi:PAP2 superfamily
VVGLGTYAVYLLVRRAVVTDSGHERAARNARRVCELEERLGIHLGPRLQRVLLPHRRLLAVLNVSYVTLNVLLTVGWLMLLYRRRDSHFHRLRRAAAIATLAAQPAFLLFPCGPPRSLDHFVDTVGEVLDLDSGLVVRLYNPIAAMPSIHMAFAVVTGAGLAQAGRSPLTRAFGRLYPAAVLGVVVGTANHYVLDGVAGGVLALAALRLSGRLERAASVASSKMAT